MHGPCSEPGAPSTRAVAHGPLAVVAIASALCSLGTTACRPERVPLSGWDAQGYEPRFPAVVGVTYHNGISTGVALSDRVVATAGHLALDLVRGCADLGYRRNHNPRSPMMVRVADASGNVFAPKSARYFVDAVAAPTRLCPANVFECCGGERCPQVCDLSGAPHQQNFVPPFDVLLLHLDRPLEGIRPMRFVAHVGDLDEAQATFPIDPEDWAGNVVAMLVGIGDADPSPKLVVGPRRFGPTTIAGLGWTIPAVLRANRCSPLQSEPFACDGCMLDLSPKPSDILPSGAMRRRGGDSGAPVIVNYTALGATPIDGLPEGEPFVVGFGSGGNDAHDFSVVSWDSELPSGESTGIGTFILGHLRDWDQDGVPDAADNCITTWNPDQRQCRAAGADATLAAAR